MGGEDFFAAENFLKPQFFFFQKILKKIFQKTHQSILRVQILQTITFLIQKSLVDRYHNHRINKYLDF